MVFSRNAFFFLVLFVLLAPFLIPNTLWLLSAKKATGRVEGIGHATGISLGSDTYALVSFSTNSSDTVFFQGKDDNYEKGLTVPLLYQAKDPEDAKINSFWSLWGKTISYCGVPLIFWVIVFFARDLIPTHSKIAVGGKPFLRLIDPEKVSNRYRQG